MALSTGMSWCFAIKLFTKSLVTTRTLQHSVFYIVDACSNFYAIQVNCMKLFAAPLLLTIQSEVVESNFWFQLERFFV